MTVIALVIPIVIVQTWWSPIFGLVAVLLAWVKRWGWEELRADGRKGCMWF